MSTPTSFQDIYLPSIDCGWQLRFHAGSLRNRIYEQQAVIDFYLRDSAARTRLMALRHWLKRKAVLELTPWLSRVSRECGLPFHSVRYRGQRRRWGSCTADGRISLNYHLLFLPAEQVQYVLIHELCHTVHFNHSAEFWGLVASFLPNCRELKKAVRYADHYLPAWIRQAT